MLKIKNKIISQKHRPYIIAEMSANHNGSLERALKIVDAAAASGADAIKLQTYTADTLTMKSKKKIFKVQDKNSLWSGQYLYDLYKKGSMPWEWHKEIFQHAKKKGIHCFSSPFDNSAVDLLENLNAPAYKIASSEIIDVNLIKYIASTGKPIIMSTGMASINEIYEAVNVLEACNCKNFALLKCTANYPANAKGSNLTSLKLLRDLFKCEVGFSDHTLGIGSSIAAVVMGASIIEKHMTLKKSNKGIDSEFSLEPKEMKSLVDECHAAQDAIGESSIGPSKQELPSLRYRRSLFVCGDIKKGEKFTIENIKSIRPNAGLHPRYLNDILGKTATMSVDAGTPLSWKLVGK